MNKIINLKTFLEPVRDFKQIGGSGRVQRGIFMFICLEVYHPG